MTLSGCYTTTRESISTSFPLDITFAGINIQGRFLLSRFLPPRSEVYTSHPTTLPESTTPSTPLAYFSLDCLLLCTHLALAITVSPQAMNYTDNISINTRIVDNSIGVPHHHDQARKTSTESQLNTRSTSFDSNSPAQFADNSSAESSSTRLVSPISNSSDTFNMLSGQFPSVFGNSVNPAYGYSTQQPSSSGSNASFNYPFYPNQSTGTDYTGGTGQGYTSGKSLPGHNLVGAFLTG
jgi:hypothetical protein